MELVEHLFQMQVMGVIVNATDVDVVTDVLYAGYTTDSIAYFPLEYFCSTLETKVETLVPE